MNIKYQIIHDINNLFENTFLKVFIPQRKVGETFKIGSNKYIVRGGAKSDSLASWYCSQCDFYNHCDKINIVRRGRCAAYNRHDNQYVYFNKI